MFKNTPHPRRKQTWRQGFTLIELLVVISIIGTLVAVFSVSTGHAKESAQIAKATAEAREITNSIRLFALTNMKLDDEGEGYDDPLEQIGVSEGFSDISTTTTTKLTDPKSNDRNVRYFNCSAESIVKGRIVDPWGNPYKIRVKKIEMGRTEKDKDDLAQEYEVILPLHSHYTELSKIQSDITSSGAIGN